MSIRRTVFASALGLGLVLGPAAASWADYPPTPTGTPTSSVSPTPTRDAGALPRTGTDFMLPGVVGAALLGGGAVAVAASRRRGAKR